MAAACVFSARADSHPSPGNFVGQEEPCVSCCMLPSPESTACAVQRLREGLPGGLHPHPGQRQERGHWRLPGTPRAQVNLHLTALCCQGGKVLTCLYLSEEYLSEFMLVPLAFILGTICDKAIQTAGRREACLPRPALHRVLLTAANVRCRCIQRADQPIILTGYSALNKLLGRDVYSSHLQLGGPKVGTSA